MKDERVAKLYAAVRDVVEAIGDQAFIDYGEVQNKDTKARMDRLRREFKFVGQCIPRYPKPFRVEFTDDDYHWTKDFKTEDEAGWAVVYYLEHRGHGQNGVHNASYYDRRAMWK